MNRRSRGINYRCEINKLTEWIQDGQRVKSVHIIPLKITPVLFYFFFNKRIKIKTVLIPIAVFFWFNLIYLSMFIGFDYDFDFLNV